jgi:small subunit ribosomal protein S8
MTNPMADFLTRIRNGYQARLELVRMPHTQFKEAVAKVLVKSGFLGEATVKIINKRKTLVVKLKYLGRRPAVTKIVMVSKPGLRVYKKAEQLPFVRRGLGITIVSTVKGVMTAREARRLRLGGEVISQVW